SNIGTLIPDVATDQRGRKPHHHMPAKGHDVPLPLVGGAHKHDGARLQEAADLGGRVDGGRNRFPQIPTAKFLTLRQQRTAGRNRELAATTLPTSSPAVHPAPTPRSPPACRAYSINSAIFCAFGIGSVDRHVDSAACPRRCRSV